MVARSCRPVPLRSHLGPTGPTKNDSGPSPTRTKGQVTSVRREGLEPPGRDSVGWPHREGRSWPHFSTRWAVVTELFGPTR